MYKLVLVILMMVVWIYMHAMQTDEEMAMAALFQGKHAVNRAAHAAAQQLDRTALAEGRFHIDETAAGREAAYYLQKNLQLDESWNPLPGAYLREPVEILAFEVINGDRTFPFTYKNDTYRYEVTLERPGVVIIVKIKYPQIFSVLEPIEWEIKGTAQLVES